MIKKIIISVYVFFSLNFVLGQVNCVEEVRKATDICKTAGNTCTVNDIISRAENFAFNPSHKICLKKTDYFLALADFCAVSVNIPGGTPDEVIRALDKAIQFVEKSGEMKPELIQKGGEGALRMIELHEYKSQIHFKQNDLANYKLAMEKREFWSGVFNGINAEKLVPNPNTYSDTLKDTLTQQTLVIHHSRLVSYIVKPLVILTQSQNEQALLMDGKLDIQANPELKVIPLDNPKRFYYSLSFEAGIKYWVTITHSEFEEQFFEFSTDQVPERDTLFIQMYKRGTPCFYTRYGKRSFVPDPFSILVIRNRYGSLNDFNKLIQELDLQVDSVNLILYHKRSGEAFDSKEDAALAKLRGRSDLIEVAGANLGTSDRINILTNQLRIIWDQKPSEMSPEDAAKINAFFQEHQLKELGDNLFEAPLGTGLELNNIVEKLNGIKGVHLAYPESFKPIYPN